MIRGTEAWIEEELAARRRAGLERRLVSYSSAGAHVRTADGRTLLNFSSNDYLGLARHPHVVRRAAEALERFGAGATASRLVAGTLQCHDELERRLAALKGYPSALVFGSGYAANLGIVGAVVGRDDTVFIDRLAHASLIDAAVLSRATIHRFRHNDCDHLAGLLRRHGGRGRRLVVTESVFSMDGDLAPLADLTRLAHDADAMMLVDEAHATGVFGPGGAGLARTVPAQATVNLVMGTLSKALGGYGAFVASSEAMRAILVNGARSFIYSTALPPAMAGSALGALEVLEREPDLGARLLARAARLRDRLRAAGLDTAASASQIVPVMAGGNEAAVRLHRALLAGGVLAVAIRPPTVPPGTARLRLSVTLGHTDADVDRVASLIAEAVAKEGAR